MKDLQESYTPKFSKEIKEALEPILQGQEINLSIGSLIKLIERDRLEFLPLIKDTLEHSDALVMQNDGALIFVKDYRHESLGKFFASVSKDNEGQWVITSNAPKNLNNLHNKIKEGGKVLYSDLPELPIIAKPELPAKALNGEANLKTDSTTKPQTNEEIIQQAKAEGKSVKETKGLIKLESIKQKTINAVDKYAQSEEFKTLSKDKQEAILRLKSIKPAPMPDKIASNELHNLIKHFNNKQDREARDYYLRLFNETKEKPDITLHTLGKNGEQRKGYIKAYQHKETHDLYYITITQDNDKVNITGFPITKIKDLIAQIKNSVEVM